MQRESMYPMVSVAEAQRLITLHTQPLGVEEVQALFAEGRILAEDVSAPRNIPDVAKSAVDGYALRASDGLAPRSVLAEITAGALQGLHITAGTAARIMTGAPLPDGADAVIMVERTQEHNGILTIDELVPAGNNIHRPGQDLAAGQAVLSIGTLLTAADIGLLASVGRQRIQVYRRPLVAVLATGDEVFEPGDPMGDGHVFDSNRYALMAAAREAGCETISLGIARDDRETQRAALLDGLERADVLLTSGGVSMGTRDLIKPLLAELGQVHFGRIAFKPGKPTTFATYNHGQQRRLIFGLPGYPVSSLVSFEVFVRPALRRLQGDAHPERPRVAVALAEAIHASDRPEYQRVRVCWEQGRLVAYSTGIQGSSRLLSMRAANALLLVAPGDSLYAAGQELEAMLTGVIASSER